MAGNVRGRTRDDRSTGYVKGIALHRRKPEQVDEIWAQFTKQMDKVNREVGTVQYCSAYTPTRTY